MFTKPLAYTPSGFKTKQGETIYFLTAPLRWEDPGAGVVEECPSGFATDFATVPTIFRKLLPWAFPQIGSWDAGCALHDQMIALHQRTRNEADATWLKAMLWSGTSKWRAYTYYHAVRFGRRFK